MITSGGTIIAVDDEPALRELLKDILEKEGYQVFSAENGKLAMDVVDAHPPDLILLDLHMPVMNGFEFFRWLKTRDVYSNVPVIFLSASVEEDVRIDGLKMGAVDYITKTCGRQELLARVRIHMELFHARFLLEQKNEVLRSINIQLQQAMDNIKVLRGLIPICANCKQIRDDEGYWKAVDQYISEHSEAKFSHAICPECFKSLYPGFPG